MNSQGQLPVVGVLGGGQLGRMMGQAAHRMGLTLIALDPKGVESPAGQVLPGCQQGSFNDVETVLRFGRSVEAVTMEIEHVHVEALRQLEASGKSVQPTSETIAVIQDKFLQKQNFAAKGLPLPDFAPVQTIQDVSRLGSSWGFPIMLKSRLGAYDGRGNSVVRDAADCERAFMSLGGHKGQTLYAERWADFDMELAVMVARSLTGEVAAYPVVETIQHENICHTVHAPAAISRDQADRAQDIARRTVASLPGAGIFGVELFLLRDGSIVVNEVAPRPHNSGHYTCEACVCDQFEQHLRAVIGLPLGSTDMKVRHATMVNVLGGAGGSGARNALRAAFGVSGATTHWYGKDAERPGRKMAHVTFVGQSRASVAKSVREWSTQCGVDLCCSDASAPAPVVGIIMGSDSDLPCMQAACSVLESFGVAFECTVVSAHRTPDRMFEYAKQAAQRGIRIIIAGAGGAAHLPGMVAALTPLPVIGVPIKSSTLSGKDSLLSIVQMPGGVPVATVAIGGAKNAALLAVRILSGTDRALLARLNQYNDEMSAAVLDKAAKLEQLGASAYLSFMQQQQKP